MRARAAFAGAVLAAGLAACGSTSNGGTVTDDSSQLAVAQCMRSHGVSNFPDPGAGGGFSVSGTPGSSTVTVDGTPFSGPAFEAAVTACKVFGGRPSPQAVPAGARQQALTFARCMRSNGVPNFPDTPTSQIDPSAPNFQRARHACGRRG